MRETTLTSKALPDIFRAAESVFFSRDARSEVTTALAVHSHTRTWDLIAEVNPAPEGTVWICVVRKSDEGEHEEAQKHARGMKQGTSKTGEKY